MERVDIQKVYVPRAYRVYHIVAFLFGFSLRFQASGRRVKELFVDLSAVLNLMCSGIGVPLCSYTVGS